MEGRQGEGSFKRFPEGTRRGSTPWGVGPVKGRHLPVSSGGTHLSVNRGMVATTVASGWTQGSSSPPPHGISWRPTTRI